MFQIIRRTFLTHDLSVVRFIADRVAVMFLGRVVETGTTDQIFQQPQHPYTTFLINAVPIPDPHKRNRPRAILKGDIPSPMNLPPGCRFQTRCPNAPAVCAQIDPPFVATDRRGVACAFPLSVKPCTAPGGRNL